MITVYLNSIYIYLYLLAIRFHNKRKRLKLTLPNLDTEFKAHSSEIIFEVNELLTIKYVYLCVCDVYWFLSNNRTELIFIKRGNNNTPISNKFSIDKHTQP